MRTVGKRAPPELLEQASGEALALGARFSESIAVLAVSTYFPKGVYRYKTHEDANRHAAECLAYGMAQRASQRAT